ncbi:MAG: DUF5722 domain-containing protein [Oscillospiraceae bacterium]|nr:DUF5722 domain-containing protein [Oscillospiraceae bacterium]
MKKCAVFILLCVICGIFFDVFDILSIKISAEEENTEAAITGDITQIKSIIPFIERTDNEIVQNVPIESQDDIWSSPGTASLRLQVYINGSDAQKYSGEHLYICKLKTYEDTARVNSENIAVSFEVRSDESFTYILSVLTDLSNFNNGEIYNKFVIAARIGDSLTPISDAKYIGNINHLSDMRDTPPDSFSKKGLAAVQMPGEARLLGVRHTTVKIVLNDFISAEPSSVNYMFGGEEFYFNMDAIAEYDRRIKYLTNEGINVTAALVISANDYNRPQLHHGDEEGGGEGGENDENAENEENEAVEPETMLRPIDHLIHGAARENAAVRPFYFGINTADEFGFKYFAALMSFIADRYVREDMGSGRIYNLILGSEIGNISMNYCGQIEAEQYAKDYMRALRIADTAARSRFGGARVYVPLDNSFAHSPDNGYVNRQLIDLLCEYSETEGNFIWNVAVHAYNADRYSLETWRESSPVDSYETPYITMKNINVLADYINIEKQAYLPDGETRKLMLAGQGFTSGGISTEGMELQAASFIYAYLKAKYTPEITAFIYHGQMDNPSEEIGYFGLWTEQGEKKLIHDVFKYMDTDKEAGYTGFAKPLLNIDKFEELIPFYPEEAEPAVILTETTGKPNRSRMNFAVGIGRFGTGAVLDGFIGSANMSELSVEEYEGEHSGLNRVLFAGFTEPLRGDFGSIFKIYDRDNALDLSGCRFVELNMRIDSDLELDAKRTTQVILTLEAETPEALYMYEGMANIRLNEDTAVYFDISEWEGRSGIHRVAVAANPYSEAYGGSGGGYDFKMYIQSVTAVNVSRINFIRSFIIAVIIIVLLLAAAWTALFIRARIIRERRRRLRELRRKRRAAANRKNT